ncbi:hypothetical protein NL676_004747 [Syzygium grande]|nr:hypothetical protein NL676_004747 [Syzygium grande]
MKPPFSITTALSWYTTPAGSRELLVGLRVIGGNDPSTHIKYKVSGHSVGGQELTKYESSEIAVIWDNSQVKDDTGPQPVHRFFLLVRVDSQAALLLGDVPKQCTTVFRALDIFLVSRAECTYA